MSKSTLKTYKKTVWLACARYIKIRDANKMGICRCCTCEKSMIWNDPDCQAGHFIPGHNNTTYFEEKIIHAQCSHCNLGGQGMQYEYGKFMKKIYGYDEATLDEMQTWRHKVKKVTMQELKDIKEYFDNEFDRIKKEKGL